MPTYEKTYDLAPGGCWVPELRIQCPFVEPPRAGRGHFCSSFDVYLQEIRGLKGQRVRRCAECKRQWQSHLSVSVMPG